MAVMSAEATGAPLGRPRDPGIDHRVATAAVELYGESGWAGSGVEAVARRAGVEKRRCTCGGATARTS
jgi:hypothetical protein